MTFLFLKKKKKFVFVMETLETYPKYLGSTKDINYIT